MPTGKNRQGGILPLIFCFYVFNPLDFFLCSFAMRLLKSGDPRKKFFFLEKKLKEKKFSILDLRQFLQVVPFSGWFDAFFDIHS